MTHPDLNNDNLSDEDLVSFLDGEADASLHAKIERLLQEDESIVARIEALEIPKNVVRDTFDIITQNAPSYIEFQNDQITRKQSSRPLLMAASLVIGLLLGGLATYILGDNNHSNQNGWMDYAASYHALYVLDTLEPVSLSEADKNDNLNSISARIDLPLNRPEIKNIFDFKRAQILGYQGRDIIQLAYLNDKGQPIALCISPVSHHQTHKTITSQIREGMASVSWSHEGFEYLLIGGNDMDILESVADNIKG